MIPLQEAQQYISKQKAAGIALNSVSLTAHFGKDRSGNWIIDFETAQALLDAPAQTPKNEPESALAEPKTEIPQPNPNGEFPSPADGAIWMAATYGIPQTPLKGKAPFLQNWPAKASTDPGQIHAWAAEYPGCNFGSVAISGKHFIFEADSVAVRERFKNRGHDFTSNLIIESSPGKGHRYYLSVPGVENIGQNKGEDFSIRANGEQCVSPGSVHPVTQKQYRVAVRNGQLTQPTPEEILFWKSERIEKKSSEVAQQVQIPSGQRNSALASIAGKLLDAGMAPEKVKQEIIEINEQRCTPPLSRKELDDTIFHSIDTKWSKKEDAITRQVTTGKIEFDTQAPQTATEDLSWLDVSEAAARPIFPDWILKGTSLYEGLAKPVSDVNSKFPELIWLPAVQLMLNYLHNKVSISGMRLNVNIFLGIISSPGKFFKSSSCRLAHEYFGHMGLAVNLAPSLRNSEGKIVIGQAGSSEGFGLQLQNANAKHGILFNGELGKLVSKAGIENSSLPHDLLLWYESEDFSNTIKNRNQSFAFPAGTYCFGWQFCTTTRGFNSQWPRIAGIASGMPDRTFFLVTPEEPKSLSSEVFVNTVENAIGTTRKLIDRAVEKKEYQISDYAKDSLLKKSAAFGDPRSMNMVYKFALYFAIDLGLDEIDEDCIARALALVDYRQKAIAFLQPIEAKNDEGRLLKEILRELRQHGGKMTRREFSQAMHPEEYGSRIWTNVYRGAIAGDYIREFTEPGTRGQVKKMIGLVRDDVRLGPE